MKPLLLVKGPAQSCYSGLIRPIVPATLVVDENGSIVRWSSAAAELFALTSAEAVGRPVTDLVRSDEHEKVKAALAEVQTGRRWRGVLAVICCGDSACDVDLCWDPLSGGEAGQVAVIANPTTDLGSDGVADAGQVRMALLSEASIRIGTSLDIRQTGSELMDVAVPRLADAAAILVKERLLTDDEFPDRLTDGGTAVRWIAVGVTRPEPEGWKDELRLEESVVYAEGTPYFESMALSRSVMFGRPPSSQLAVPLRARGKVLGCVVLMRSPERPAFGQQDTMLAEELAFRTAICMDNARLYNTERRTALTLQSSLLPTGLQQPLGLDIAHRYLPASDLTGVGGDWYDVIPLPGGRVALVVGDVMGHGTNAAAAMGQLRTAVRTLAALDLPPDEVLDRLDQMIQEMGGMQNATCIYATYDPVEQVFAVSRAGHIPPIVLHTDGTSDMLELPPGLPLGIGGEAFETRTVRLSGDSTLVLLTDGLVESRDRDIDAGIAALRANLAGSRRQLEELCDGAINALRPNHDRDDIALLLARVRPLDAESIATTRLPTEASSAGHARTLVREALTRWGLDQLLCTAELVVSEMVTNAVQHGRGPIEVRLLRASTLVCEVADSSPIWPSLQLTDPVALAENGRGVQLVKLLSRRWGTRPMPAGKIVWCELSITPPDLL